MRNTLHSYITYIKDEHKQGNLMLRNETWRYIKCNPDYNNVSRIMHYRWHDVGDRDWFIYKYIELHRDRLIDLKIVKLFHFYSKYKSDLFSHIVDAGLNTKAIFKIFYDGELSTIKTALADNNLSKSVLFYILDILDEDFPDYTGTFYSNDPDSFEYYNALRNGIKGILDTIFSSFDQNLIKRVFDIVPYIKSRLSFEYLLEQGYHEDVFLTLEFIDADYVKDLEQWNYNDVAKYVNDKRRALLLHYLIPDLSGEVLRML